MPELHHIIMAEYDPHLRHIYADLLSRVCPQARLLVAADATEAMALYAHGGADLLIIDQDLPGISGTALVQTLHAIGVTIPMVIVSSSDDLFDLAHQIGVTYCLAKADALTQLAAIILTAYVPGEPYAADL